MSGERSLSRLPHKQRISWKWRGVSISEFLGKVTIHCICTTSIRKMQAGTVSDMHLIELILRTILRTLEGLVKQLL